MNLRYLQFFVTVAEELNFTRAAERLHVTQPALSMQIQNLEAELGTTLLARESRNVRLTDAGRIYLGKARQMLALASDSADMARRAAKGEIGHLSIGYNNPASFRIFPKLVPAFRRKRPDVHLTFHDLRVPQQIASLRRDELDLGIVWLPIPTDEFDVHELITERFIAVLPTDHRLASASSIGIENLSHEPLIVMPRAMDPESYQQIEQLFRRNGAVMNVAYELETLLSMLGFVAMGCGCSILPEYARNIRRKGVVYKRLRPPNIVKSLAIIKKKHASDLAQAFFKFAADSIGDSSTERGRRSNS